MRTICKLIRVNDSCETNVSVNDFLLVGTYPRIDAIISAFLNEGYELHSRNFRVTPGKHGTGESSFYLGGWDLLFVKNIEDDERDNSNEILRKAVESVTHNTNRR